MSRQDHNHSHEESQEPLVLIDEEGNEHAFQVVEILEVDGNSYAILAPLESDIVDADEEDEEACVLFRIDTVDGEEHLTAIDDDEEIARVQAAWEELNDDWEWEEQDTEDGDED